MRGSFINLSRLPYKLIVSLKLLALDTKSSTYVIMNCGPKTVESFYEANLVRVEKIERVFKRESG